MTDVLGYRAVFGAEWGVSVFGSAWSDQQPSHGWVRHSSLQQILGLSDAELVITTSDRVCQPLLNLGDVSVHRIGDCIAPRALVQAVYEGRTVGQRL